jgi:hypothetical protein
MGFFGGGKKIYVASALYNLAGDEAERIEYLKTIVAGSVITNSKFSMSEAINNSYIGGPGIKARSYYRWCLDNYSGIGVPEDKIKPNYSYDDAAIATNVPKNAGETVRIESVDFGPPEFSFWADQYMIENHPTLVDTAWIADAVGDEITITFADTTQVTFTAGYDLEQQYLYVVYHTLVSGVVNATRMFIYEIGSGIPALDEVPLEETTPGGYLPSIPLRLDNEFLSSTYLSSAYNLAKRAYKKATGLKYDELIEKVADNEDLDDIDHATIVFAVPLNTKDNSSKKYLYKFFSEMLHRQTFDQTTYETYLEELEQHQADLAIYNQWVIDGSIGTPPTVSPYPSNSAQGNSVRITNTGSMIPNRFDFEIKWTSIEEAGGTGLYAPGAKVGQAFVQAGDSEGTANGWVWTGDGFFSFIRELQTACRITIQTGPNNWKRLTIQGLKHINRIYKDKSVDTSAGEAIIDTEESGFLVPLNYEFMREMSLVDSTQMCTASTFIVFNCYKVVKQKWYQTGIFKVFVFIAIIFVSVVFAPAGAAMTAAYASIGAALGLTGIMAVIAGAAIIALAQMVLMKILTEFSVALLGEKFGMIIAAALAFTVGVFGPGLLAGQSLATMWGSMMSAQNIMLMTSAVGDGISGYMAASAQETMQKTEELLANYQKESGKIEDLYAENIGYGKAFLDPFDLTNFMAESEDQFLYRTLLTGSDIAEISMDMLTNYSNYTLSLK